MLIFGMTINEILEDHEELEREDILACLKYAKINGFFQIENPYNV